MELSPTSTYTFVELTSKHLVGYWNCVLKSSNSKPHEVAAFIGISSNVLTQLNEVNQDNFWHVFAFCLLPSLHMFNV